MHFQVHDPLVGSLLAFIIAEKNPSLSFRRVDGLPISMIWKFFFVKNYQNKWILNISEEGNNTTLSFFLAFAVFYVLTKKKKLKVSRSDKISRNTTFLFIVSHPLEKQLTMLICDLNLVSIT